MSQFGKIVGFFNYKKFGKIVGFLWMPKFGKIIKILNYHFGRIINSFQRTEIWYN